MLKTYLLLFYEFLKTGLFSVGGGYATLPFLFHMTENYDWFTKEELTNMIAISNITPGPVGINMATYTGFTMAGIFGSFLSTFAVVAGPFILALIVIYFLNKFREAKIIKAIFKSLRPTSCALLSFVAIQLIIQDVFNDAKWSELLLNFNLRAFLLLIVLFILYKYLKSNPSLIILAGALLGFIFNLF